MTDPKLFRQYIDIVNEESPIYAQRNQQAAQKWAQENPGSAQALKIGADVVTDFIPGVSQVKSAYRAGKAALAGDYGEAGRQAVGAVVPGGRRIVSAVDAGLDAAKGNYGNALSNLSYAAGGDIARVAGAYNLGSTVANLTGVGGNNQPAISTTQTAQTTQAPATNQPTTAEPIQTAQASNTGTDNTLSTFGKGGAMYNALNKKPEPTTEEKDNMDNRQTMRKYMDFLDEAPIQAINPNDPNAAAFGRKINAPAQQNAATDTTSSGYTAQSQAQKTPTASNTTSGQGSSLASQYIAANSPAQNIRGASAQPAVNNQSSGYNAQSQAQNTRGASAQSANVDTAATAARDKLQQQMSSGKIAAPAPQTVNPNQQYGGGYDPTKVQYASGTNPKAGPTASATQSAALDASKANVIGGGTQVASSQPVNNQSSGYTAQSQAQNTAPNATTASTGGGFQGGGYGSVGTSGQTATAATSAPTQTSDQIATAALNAPAQDTSGTSLGRQAAFGQMAEEDESHELNDLKRLAIGYGADAQADQIRQASQDAKSSRGDVENLKKGLLANFSTEKEIEEALNKMLTLSGQSKHKANEATEKTGIKKFLNIINESTEKTEINESIELHDSFDLELSEHFVVETGIIGFKKDGIIIEADETLLGLLEIHDVICEDETLDQREEEVAEAEYQGRKVSLGKPMAGDVKKSKVYVKKPNGKVVKVNFGDKKMKIKKSNPKRRKSFRARHRCENPGPRWKARYWSCRAW